MRLCLLLCAAQIWRASITRAQTPFDIYKYLTPTTVKVYSAAPTTPSYTTTTTEATCVTDDNRQGICVERKFCNSEGNIITTGTNLFLKRREFDGQCPGNTVCCVMSSRSSTTSSPTTSSSTTISTSTTGSSGTSTISEKKGCGWRYMTNTVNRIYGNDQALFGEFSWALPIFKIEDNVEKYICGGSLIHPRLVLTYASKFTRKGNFVVKPGDYDILGDYEIYGHQTIEVAKRIVHEKYNSGGNFNDIAILVLKEDVKPDKHIGFACLPSANIRPTAGTQCIATGWGVDKEVNGTMQNIPKMVSIPYIEHDECQSRLRQELRPSFVLHDTVMCLGALKDEDTCKGDGGSPLVCEYPGTKDRFYQAGIVSWGLHCGREGLPSMYSDVAALRSWVDRVVQNEGFDAPYYTPS